MTAEFEADGLRGRSVGDMLRRWRAQRRLSQLDLALSAEVSLHPAGLAPGIENLSEWRRHLLDRLRREAEGTGDPGLTALLEELHAYPAPLSDPAVMAMRENGVAVPLVLRATGDRPRLSLLSTTTVFGTATSVTLSELALEAFYPTDDVTREFLQSVRPVAAVAH